MVSIFSFKRGVGEAAPIAKKGAAESGKGAAGRTAPGSAHGEISTPPKGQPLPKRAESLPPTRESLLGESYDEIYLTGNIYRHNTEHGYISNVDEFVSNIKDPVDQGLIKSILRKYLDKDKKILSTTYSRGYQNAEDMDGFVKVPTKDLNGENVKHSAPAAPNRLEVAYIQKDAKDNVKGSLNVVFEKVGTIANTGKPLYRPIGYIFKQKPIR